VVEEWIEIGPWRIAIERPANPEALIDEESFADDEFLPYWAELWPSAIAVARHLAPLPLAGQRVLELGCGLGLPAIVAAKAGGHVLATDCAHDALAFVARNARRNDARVETAVMTWTTPSEIRRHGTFDLVLAADVLYEERNAAPLLAMLDRAVAEGGTALVADPGRLYAAAFLSAARSGPWCLETVSDPALPRGGIHRLWRNPG
jgi:predicted nicotinamide N-methyase